MKRKAYSAGAVKHSFWFSEFRKVVLFLADGISWDEIKRLCLTENLFGATSSLRASQIWSTVSGRIRSLPENFYPIFQKGEISTQKLFALTAAMAYDSLFADFVYEVIREKMIIGINEFSDSDVKIFFKNKQEQDEKVAHWTDETINRLGKCYKTMLFESGLTDKSQEKRKINRPILEPEFAQWLQNNDLGFYFKALTGVR